MGIGFAHGVGAHFHGGHDFEQRRHYWRDTLGGGVGVGPDDQAAPIAPFYDAPRLVENYSPPPRVSDGPRIIILDDRKAHGSRAPLPVVIYGDPAS